MHTQLVNAVKNDQVLNGMKWANISLVVATNWFGILATSSSVSPSSLAYLHQNTKSINQ